MDQRTHPRSTHPIRIRSCLIPLDTFRTGWARPVVAPPVNPEIHDLVLSESTDLNRLGPIPAARSDLGSIVDTESSFFTVVVSTGYIVIERRQHPEVVEELARAGLHRMSVAVELGGLGLPLADTFAVLETIAAADASAGWCLMVGSEILGPLAGHLPVDTGARFVADNPTATVSGSASPTGIATPVDGGYRVTSRWTFGSGFYGAEYWMGGCKVVPRSPDGGNYLLAVIPTAELTPIEGTWNVNGLVGTGSVEVQATDLFVPTAMMANTTTPATVDTPLYRVPLSLRWAHPKAAIAVGVADGAVHTFIDLAGGKTPKGERSTLAERPRAQIAAAEATALVHQARAWCNETLNEVWDLAVEGKPVPD